MRHTVRQYAEALTEGLEGKKESRRGEALARFVKMLRRNGDMQHLDRILVQYERMFLAKSGLVKIEIESPAKLSDALVHEIESSVGKPVVLIEKTNPKLLAGLRILLNDTLLIDATGKRRLESLF
jgi:F0F1-type ATP synthase delta subunit